MIAALQRRPGRWFAAGVAAFGAGLVLACAALELALRFAPIDPRPYLQSDRSPVILDRNGLVLHASLNSDDSWCFPKDLDAHSDYLIDATTAVEDQRYWSHGGVDIIAIFRAFLQNAAERTIASGASTITMQLVKLQTDRPRSLAGKCHQAWDALRLERGASKDAILSAYLDRAPYGYNLIGAEAAARRYFGKSTKELTLKEAALLAGLPKAPGVLDPLRNPEAALARRNFVLTRMRKEDLISAAQLRRTVDAPLGAKWHKLPKDAPHLPARLPAAGYTQSTLDTAIQRQTQALLKHYLKQYGDEITNAAAIVIDVNSADVLAYCGSADFFHSDGGQIDLARAIRSPGSALKPFIYAMAMQERRVYSSEMLLDDTLDYGDYSPANYDGEFTGLISAGEALRYSLNVPAVQVLERVGVPAACKMFHSLGMTTVDQSPTHYGLGLTLGNCGVRLDELAAAYRALAAMGEYAPLRFSPQNSPPTTRGIFHEDVAVALYEILRRPLPKESPDGLVKPNDTLTPVAWKTGTSTGHHDAWAFVFNRHYVVGVWLGNADGQSSIRLVGADAAAPVAAAIFRRLPAKTSAPWPDVPNALRLVRVCSASGLPATSSCHQTRDARLPRSAHLTRRCDVHRTASTRDGTIQQWPATASHWNLAKVGNPIPVDAPDGLVRTALRIANPVNAAEYILTGKPGADRIRLKSSLDYEQPVHWYCDGRYLGASYTTEPVFWNLEPGKHEIACMVSNGTTDSVRITVHSPHR